MSIDNALASLAVKDLGTAIPWYEALLGRAADSSPMPTLAEWKFPGGGGLQVYHLPERAGEGSVTLVVSDIDDVVAHVGTLGIDTSQRTSGETVKTLMIADPDGNHIAFAQAMEEGLLR